MSVTLRVLLIVVSLLVVIFVLKKVRKAHLNIDDAIYWIVFSLFLFLISIFPQVAEWIAELIGVESPANFVFLFMIFVILVKLFNLAIDLSVQKQRLNRLVQKLALLHEEEVEAPDRAADADKTEKPE